MRLDQITPLVLTWNEEPNLRRCLERLRWAKEVIILDSGSTDATASIAAEFPNTRLLVRVFDDHTSQWNFGVDAVQTRWVLSLDADYVIGPGMEDDLQVLEDEPAEVAFYASFRYLIHGTPLHACLYPPRAVLFRKDRCCYVNDGHTQLLQITGKTAELKTKIDHDDRKPLSRWFVSQDKYARLEAEKLSQQTELSLQDRIRRTLILGPIVVFGYTLLVKMAILNGWAGWYYTFQRTLAEIMLSLRLIEKKICKASCIAQKDTRSTANRANHK